MFQKNKINKKAQEEMVGFVLIMLVVAVIFLVFLGIYMRGASKTHETQGKDLAAFLEAVTKITPPCETAPGYPYEDLSRLIIECDNNPSVTCYNGEKICDLLKETLTQAINSTWNFDENSVTKSYKVDVFKETQTGEKRVVEILPPALTTRNIRSAEKPFPKGIILRLEIYY